jgi:hypothetical protein
VRQRTTIAFADAAAEIAGVALSSAGTLLSLGGELSPAGAPQLEGGSGAWTLGSAGSYTLSLDELGEPASLHSGASVQLCRARGSVAGHEFDAFATITATPAEREPALERSLAVSFDHELSLALLAQRAADGAGHGDEQLEAAVFRGDPPVASLIERPRLSTTYRGDGLPSHAGVELWQDEESEYALRLGGEALTNGELIHTDGARSRVVFMAWHHERHRGLGSYTLTRAPAAR